MVGGSDPFRCYFEKMDGDLLKCMFCEKKLARGTSATRMKYHLARVGGGGVKICEKVTPDVQQAAFDKLFESMRGSMPSSSNNIIVTADSDPAQDLEMQQQGHPLLDEFPSMDSLIGEEIWLAEETMVPSMLMPDAPETGLGKEPADQPFEKDMNNIPYSLMRNVELSSGTENMTWELRQAVTERGSCSKMPVDKSVPSSSNNIIVTADSDPAQDLEMQQQGHPLLDEFPSMDSLTGEEIWLAEETMVPSMLMPDAPETGLGIEPADQPFEKDMNNIPYSLMRNVELSSGTENMTWELRQAVTERGSCSKMPVDKSVPSSSNNIIVTADSDPAQDLEMQQQGHPLLDEFPSMDSLTGEEIWLAEETMVPSMLMPDASVTGLGIEPAVQAFETDMNNITSSLTRDVVLSSGIESRELMQAVTERGSCSKMPVDKSVPSSSNNEGINAASTALRGLEMEQEEQPLSDERGRKRFLIGGETELVEEPRAPVVLMPDEPETRQRTEQAHQSFEMNLNSISSSSMREFELRTGRLTMSPELMQSVVERRPSSKRPEHKKRRTGSYVLPTTKLVGQAMERNMNDVCSWLLNDEVSCIGICGMGGVGKTALATHIYNQLHEKRGMFHPVRWITMSQDFSIYALQGRIAEVLDLKPLDENDAMVRTGELLTELNVKKKGFLILDNLWGHFLPDEVGIPLRTDGWKLILTTRSLEICRKMDCQRIIKVEPLSKGEAWDLFKYRLGPGGAPYPEIAESIVKECDGLPLGIVTMARSMKGVYGEYGWRDALLKLRRLEDGPGEMEANVFRVLEFSYAQLNSSALQECFLHITLFPKGKIILREDLIEYLIDEGIVKEMGIRHARFDRGHTMLDQLEDASLLEGSRDDEDYRYVKMHDLIWDMAWKILNESGGAMVQAGAQLTELPDVRWWREELLRVSLMENRIENIPTDFSPTCPRLLTLLLCRNYKLNLVEDYFFQHLIGLKVLDLSDTDIEKLPDSISHLTRLTALLLGWCAKLSYVPSLAKLKALEKLDLSYTGLEDLPEGMESLKDLRYLNLDGSGVRVLRSGILPQLSKLQFLKLHQKSEVVLSVRGDEVSRLYGLETLECNFRDLDDFGYFRRGPRFLLVACKVTVGEPCFSSLEDLNYTRSKSGLIKEACFYHLEDLNHATFLFPHFITKVVFVSCQNMRSLGPSDAIGWLEELEILHLDDLIILETLFEAPSELVFFNLREIVIHKCHGMKVLLPPWLIQNERSKSWLLHQLEVIVVEDCVNMQEIIGSDEHSSPFRRIDTLRVLVLKKLPNLKSIYSGRLLCDSLEEITVRVCQQLTRIPIAISPSLKKIEVDPESLLNTVDNVP